MTTAIWWIRRDLRLTDNQTLAEAMAQADRVVPVFILDATLLDSPYAGSKRLAFLLAGLRTLAADLQDRDSQLIVREGQAAAQLEQLMAESGAGSIFAEADVSPYASYRDSQVADRLPLKLCSGLTVYPPKMVLKDDGAPYTVYTPYSRSWKSLPPPTSGDLLPSPKTIATPSDLTTLPIPADLTLPAACPFQAGEFEAQRRLQAFTAEAAQNDAPPIYGYAEGRNRLDLAATAQLSPYLRFGMLSARQAAVAALAAQAEASTKAATGGATTWLNELIWREFYIAVLAHFPHVRGGSFRPKYDQIRWRNNEAEFAAWAEGRTGYPIVDAAMRQLVQSGWMHNRARLVVASFLVKDLLIDWRWGERFFMQHLIDGDPAANNGGWQWSAGTGTDAAPYFRIFNPILQSKKFDPEGRYIQRWLPELANVPQKYIHTPWEMPDGVQQQAGCRLDRDYPTPIVDHKVARERTLAAYDRVK